jgi:predicted peptidase
MNGVQLCRTSFKAIQYLLYLPSGYSPENPIPLMLFLHGSGERGNDLERLKKYGPPCIVETKQELPFIVLSPQCPANEYWHAGLLKDLLDEVLAETNADKDRIYLSGVSMGGYGAWALAIDSPERFAAVVPICGGGDKTAVNKLRDVPVWAFHGAKDEVVPASESQGMVDQLKKAGGNVRFTLYPDAGHDCWTDTYDNKEVFAWLLEQKRKSPMA